MIRDVLKLEEVLDGIVYDLEEMNLVDFVYWIDEIFEWFEGVLDLDGVIYMVVNEVWCFLGNLRLCLDFVVNVIFVFLR